MFGSPAVNLHSVFHGWMLKGLTVGQAVPEIHVRLSVGSKLELLLRALVFAKNVRIHVLPCIYTHAFVRLCIILPCI